MTVLVATVGTNPLPVYYAVQTHRQLHDPLERVLLVCSGPTDQDMPPGYGYQPELAYGTRWYAESIRAVLHRQLVPEPEAGPPLPAGRKDFFVQVVPVGPDLDMPQVGAALAELDLPGGQVVLDYTGGSAALVAAALVWYEQQGERRLGRSYVDATHQVLRWKKQDEDPRSVPLPPGDSLEVVARLHGYTLAPARAAARPRRPAGATPTDDEARQATDLEDRVAGALRWSLSAHLGSARGCRDCERVGAAAGPDGAGENRYEVRRGWAAFPLLNPYLDATRPLPLREFDVVARCGRGIVAVECKLSADRFRGEVGWAARTSAHVFGSFALTGLAYRDSSGLDPDSIRLTTTGLSQVSQRGLWVHPVSTLERAGPTGVHRLVAPAPAPVTRHGLTTAPQRADGAPLLVTGLGAAGLAAFHTIRAGDEAAGAEPRQVVALVSQQGADAGDGQRFRQLARRADSRAKLLKNVSVDLTDEAAVARAAAALAPTGHPVVYDGTAGTKATTVGLLVAHLGREATGEPSQFRVTDARTRHVSVLEHGELSTRPLERQSVPWEEVMQGYATCLDSPGLQRHPHLADAVTGCVPQPGLTRLDWWGRWQVPLIQLAPAHVVALTGWDRIVFVVIPDAPFPTTSHAAADACHIVERVALQVDTAAAHLFGDAAGTVVVNPWPPARADPPARAEYQGQLRERYGHGRPLFLLSRPGRRVDLVPDPAADPVAVTNADGSGGPGGLHTTRALFLPARSGDEP